jgi:hypothetical protein
MELAGHPEVAAKRISVTAIDGPITLGGHVMGNHDIVQLICEHP